MLKLKATKPCRMLSDPASGVLQLLDEQLEPITSWKVGFGQGASSLVPLARAYLSSYLLEVTRGGEDKIHELCDLLGIIPAALDHGYVADGNHELDLTCRIEIYEVETSSSSDPSGEALLA